MNLYQIQRDIREKVRNAATELFSTELDQVALEFPPKTEMGDLAFPIAFELAKRIKAATGEKQNPRQIAESLKVILESDENIARVEVAGAGYLNVFLNRSKFLSESLRSAGESTQEHHKKVCVEHTSVNPNKAAHIGHVRNSVLGDTFVRILHSTGRSVEIQNYIDNTGVQVADVVVGFVELKGMDLAAIKALDEEIAASGRTFDYYCWDLYTEVGLAYQRDESLKARRAEVLHLIEAGNNETAELAEFVASRNVECILATMERFSIRY